MSEVVFSGRVFYLTRDPELLRRQLNGEQLEFSASLELIDDVSTDEIAPAWACYHYDEALGHYCLTGLRGNVIEPGALARAGFEVVVSGNGMGCGSSRETAPYSQYYAGIRLVVARSVEKIYRQNCQNIGLYVCTDFDVLERLARGQPLPLEVLTRGLDPISAEVVQNGGLFALTRRRLGGWSYAEPRRPPRPMTACEKILAAHAVRGANGGPLGVDALAPGDAIFVRADVRFTHDYVTAMADALFRREFGDDAPLFDAESTYAFRDHLTLLDRVMPAEHRALGLDRKAAELGTVQERFARRHGIRLYGEAAPAQTGHARRDAASHGRAPGSETICHNEVLDRLALPGQVVIGTDSHTCMAGALGCVAFGVGSTDMANAWRTGDVRVAVPETVRIELRGALGAGVCAKDVMLYVLSLDFFRRGNGVGKILEFAGEGVGRMSLDERATLTNMAVEAGGFTGFVEADEVVLRHVASRGQRVDSNDVAARIVRSDPDAEYAARIELDLAQVSPMVATPGDPKNGTPLSRLEELVGGAVRIDIAYGGSCTGGKRSDMDMYASVLAHALNKQRRVHADVELYIQFGSQQIKAYARERGYLEIFERVGATLLEPSCGACIRAGPGTSRHAEQVTVSAINRNFPGRSGPGAVYLASPLVVAASAILGKIASPDAI